MNRKSSLPGGDEPAGLFFAVIAFASWGILPLYWRLFGDVPPFELTVHRVLWSGVFAGGIVLVRGRLFVVLRLMRNRRILATLALTAALVSINWLVFVYSVATNQLVEASLGYYINPLLSIALGVFLMGERISRLRIVAVAIAFIGVAIKAFALGHVPWIAPVLALSFGFYGYFRKLVPAEALDALAVEMCLLFPVTCGLVVFWAVTGVGAFPKSGVAMDGLLLLAGPLTAIPLVFFSAGVRRIRLSTMGFLQYLTPTMTLLLATLFLGEAFTPVDAVTFGCVWAALALVTLEGYLRRGGRAPV